MVGRKGGRQARKGEEGGADSREARKVEAHMAGREAVRKQGKGVVNR